MSYDKEIDYQSKINEAVSEGDYESAAKYEKSRNEKIDAENLSYEKTNKYAGWLDKTDYSEILKNQMSSGATKKEVSDTLKKRVAKASGTEGLSQYAYDDIYDRAIKYIMASSYSYGGEDHKNSYDKKISGLYDKLSKIKKFSYDPYDDELFEFYRNQYVREGNRAMEDLLGELSASTGGVASSYAVSAAAQAQEEYNKKITDVIPELYNDAYERYLDDISRQERNIELLSDFSERDYKRYIDSLEQDNKDREYEYQKSLDDRNYEYKKLLDDRDYDYQKLLDDRSYEFDIYRENADNTQDEIDTAIKKWQSLGYLDEKSAAILGLPAGLHTVDYDYKKAQQYRLYNR